MSNSQVGESSKANLSPEYTSDATIVEGSRNRTRTVKVKTVRVRRTGAKEIPSIGGDDDYTEL